VEDGYCAAAGERGARCFQEGGEVIGAGIDFDDIFFFSLFFCTTGNATLLFSV
jgi:hypothetical protein